jgi:hypothetical protein
MDKIATMVHFVDKMAVLLQKEHGKMVLKKGHGQNGDHGTKGTWKTRYPSKSSIEVTTCTSSNILVWFGRDATEKGVAGSQRGSFLVPLQLQRD